MQQAARTALSSLPENKSGEEWVQPEEGSRPWRAKKLQGGKRPLVAPVILARPAPIRSGGQMSELRMRDACRKADTGLYQLSLPTQITDDKGWVIRDRPSEHQLHDKAHSNPVVASASW